MIKILVNAPSGLQELLEIDESGGYFDESRVLWDERDDGEPPEITLGGMVRDGKLLVFDAQLLAAAEASALAVAKASAARKIDADADAVYLAVVGNRATEYAQAEKEALQFQSAGYEAPVPSCVAAWASAKGWTAQVACDDILTTAQLWKGAQAAIRAARLGKKEQAKACADQSAVTVVLAAWTAAIAAIRSQLGI